MRHFIVGLLLGLSVSAGLVWAQWEPPSPQEQQFLNQQQRQTWALEQLRTLQQSQYNRQSMPRLTPCD